MSYREGARIGDPHDLCPQCGANAIHFASDFRAWGKKSLRVCRDCKAVFINDEKVGDVEVHITPQGSDATTVSS